MAKKILKFHGILLRKHIQNSYRFEKYKNERIYMDLIWMDMKIGWKTWNFVIIKGHLRAKIGKSIVQRWKVEDQ